MAGRPVFLSAEWRSLLMVNYAIEPDVLTPFVPRGVELDLWEGEALVSLVGFQFQRTSVLGVPALLHRNFPEVNLRFYVKRWVDGEWRRGVTFIRELVPKRAIAWTAKALYNEPYRALAMQQSVTASSCEYKWRTGSGWNRICAAYAHEPREMPAGSAEEFIFEHYWGYTRQRDGGTIEYAVEHPRWRAWHPEAYSVECLDGELWNDEFMETLRGKPRSVYVAEGSLVIVRSPTRIP